MLLYRFYNFLFSLYLSQLPPGLVQVTRTKTAPTPGHWRRWTCSSAFLTAQNRCPLHLAASVRRIAVRYGQRAASAEDCWPLASTAVKPTTCRRRLIRHSSFVACLFPGTVQPGQEGKMISYEDIYIVIIKLLFVIIITQWQQHTITQNIPERSNALRVVILSRAYTEGEVTLLNWTPPCFRYT